MFTCWNRIYNFLNSQLYLNFILINPLAVYVVDTSYSTHLNQFDAEQEELKLDR